MTKAIVALSGGMDSTTVLARAIHDGRDVVNTVAFTYGSKHNPHENKAAQLIARHYDVDHKLISLATAMAGFRSNLMQGGGAIPEGHYEAASMSQTVVPGRNTIFTSVLLGLAESVGASEVWCGIHSGDHAIYPDCRPEWYQAMKQVFELASEGKVTLVAPYLDGNKTTIIADGLEMEVPYRLTRTCYSDHPIACGKCGACQERLEAFSNNNTTDPINYRSRSLMGKPKAPRSPEAARDDGLVAQGLEPQGEDDAPADN